MKKTVLATLLALSVGTAMAASVTVDAQNMSPADNGPNAQQLQLSVKAPVTTLLSVDGAISTQQTDTTNKLSSRAEAGLTAQAPVYGPVDGYARVAIGEKAVSGAERFGYYSTEAGVVYHTPVAGLDAKFGLRHREAFASGRGDTTNTQRFALSYALTKVDTIGVRYDHVRGDGAGNASAVFYTRGF